MNPIFVRTIARSVSGTIGKGGMMTPGQIRFSSSDSAGLVSSIIPIMGLVSRFVAGSAAGWGLGILILKYNFLENKHPAKEEVEKSN